MKVSYTETRAKFAALWDRVCEERETLIVQRRGAEDIAILPAAELASLEETAHLVRSPANAKRLLSALNASFEGEGESVEIKQLRDEVGGG